MERGLTYTQQWRRMRRYVPCRPADLVRGPRLCRRLLISNPALPLPVSSTHTGLVRLKRDAHAGATGIIVRTIVKVDIHMTGLAQLLGKVFIFVVECMVHAHLAQLV